MNPAATLGRARRAGADVSDAARAAREARRAAVLEARAQGLTLREIAAELGVCHQRVWQIAHDERSDEQ
jgi:DNA-directed RNA polymerase specialized sigma24 family protein